MFFIIKYGEIALKGENKGRFVGKLAHNIKIQLERAGGICSTVIKRQGRLYVSVDSQDIETVTRTLTRVCGITRVSRAVALKKDFQVIAVKALELVPELLVRGSSFKVECRRTDKGFPLNSYELACALGESILTAFPQLRVNLDHPDWVLNLEIREQAYLYGVEYDGPQGLPCGVSGSGLLLLSGGIDSPVAGYLMCRRGMIVHSVYFHTKPFTSELALGKVKDLAQILAQFQPQSRLFIVPFTDVQIAIKKAAPQEMVTLLSRAAMMKIASELVRKHHFKCLITGESLGQVASQTIESLNFTGSLANQTVLRPLIGMDKESIIVIAKKINSFAISIQPYADCCTLFAPQHPLTRPNKQTVRAEFDRLALDPLLEEAVAHVETQFF